MVHAMCSLAGHARYDDPMIYFRKLLGFSAAVAASLTLSACGSHSSSNVKALAHPKGSDQVVIRVSFGGGFVAPLTSLRMTPTFTLYGDGTVIVPADRKETQPGPAALPLLQGKLSESQVQDLLGKAKKAGLLDQNLVDYGGMGSIGIADAPTTTVEINGDGQRITHRAYALGMTAGSSRMPADQARARRQLADFVDHLPKSAASHEYSPDSIAVYVAPAFAGQTQSTDAPIEWPLKSDLSVDGKSSGSSAADYRCILVSGADATVLLQTLKKANEQSQWVSRQTGSITYQLSIRPLLPDENGCS